MIVKKNVFTCFLGWAIDRNVEFLGFNPKKRAWYLKNITSFKKDNCPTLQFFKKDNCPAFPFVKSGNPALESDLVLPSSNNHERFTKGVRPPGTLSRKFSIGLAIGGLRTIYNHFAQLKDLENFRIAWTLG